LAIAIYEDRLKPVRAVRQERTPAYFPQSNLFFAIPFCQPVGLSDKRRIAPTLDNRQIRGPDGKRIHHRSNFSKEAYESSVVDQPGTNDLSALLRRSIEEFPEAQKEGIDRAFFLGMSRREIATLRSATADDTNHQPPLSEAGASDYVARREAADYF
jgi:hypothetical protein